MLRESEFTTISNLLGEGFFADKVVDMLKKDKSVNHGDEQTLVRIQGFLEKVLTGQEQVSSARLSSTTIESIDAYHRAINAFQKALTKKTEEVSKRKFQELIESMKTEISQILDTKQVRTERAKITLNFFKHIRQVTIMESSEYFSNRVVLQWPKRPIF